MDKQNKSVSTNATATKITKSIAIAIWLMVIAMVVVLFMLMNGSSYYKIDQNGQELHGEFMLYEGKVYVAVPSNGFYPVEEANVASLRALSDNRQDDHVALDKNHVYCGNQILPNLDPTTTIALGNNYYGNPTNGKLTYYCSRSSERNFALKWWQELWQTLVYQLSCYEFISELFNAPKYAKKPQTYLYPFNALPASDMPYQPALDRFTGIATNGTQVYYHGQPMPQASPNGLRMLQEKEVNRNDTRDSPWYFADGKHVYHKNQLLPVADNPQLYTFAVNDVLDIEYLFDPQDNMVYAQNLPFDSAHAPYQLISRHGEHVYHALFIGKEPLGKAGVYFYNTQTNQIQRAGDSPFTGADGQANFANFSEIAPYVFSDGKQTLYLESYEKWVRSSGRGTYFNGLYGRFTYVYQLNEGNANQWQKIGKVGRGMGSAWQNGDRFYYFDEYGTGQLIFHTIYRIADHATVQQMLSDEFHRDDIFDLIEEDRLVVPQRTKLLEAETKFNEEKRRLAKISKWWFYALIAMGLLISLIRAIKKKQQ